MPVIHEQQELVLPLIVVDGDGLPLLGRNWLEQLKFIWRNPFHVSKNGTLSDVLSRHKMVFDKGQATIKGFRADAQLQDGAKPIFYNAPPAAYSLCQKMEDKLDRLEKLGFQRRWNGVTGLLPFLRTPKSTSICDDFKVLVQ